MENGVDSKEELYTTWWLDELKKNGYVLNWYRCDTYLLSPTINLSLLAPRKKKPLVLKKTILKEHRYTPDFVVEWSANALRLFIDDKGVAPLLITKPDCFALGGDNCKLFTILEVKPVFDSQNMTRLFRLNQKWMLAKFGVFVNLVIPEKLFEQTFAPARYLFTDKSGKTRKLKRRLNSLDEYVNKSADN